MREIKPSPRKDKVEVEDIKKEFSEAKKMKSKPILTTIIFSLLLLMVMGGVSADANTDFAYNCSNHFPIILNQSYMLTSDCIINATSSSTGAITIGASNVTLDCNGGGISGNGTGYGIRSDTFNNVTIQNCNVRGYNDIEIYLSNSKNSTIKNNILYGGNISSLRLNVITSTLIYNNTIYANTTAINGAGIRFNWGNFNNITNNIITGNAIGIWIQANSNNLTINNNFIQNVDQGIVYQGSNYIWILNNTIDNTTSNWDGYNLGIHGYEDWSYKTSGYFSTYVNISNNNILRAGTTPILIQGGNNITISYNVLDNIPISQRSNYLADDWSDYPCGIYISPVYKTYSATGGVATDITDKIYNLSSSGVNILGNTFTNSQCYLVTSNVTGLTTDFTSYYNWSFNAMTGKLKSFQFYIPNSITQLYRYAAGNRVFEGTTNRPYNTYSNAFFNYICGQNPNCWNLNYTISKSNLIFASNGSQSNNLTLDDIRLNYSICINKTSTGCEGVVNNVNTWTYTVGANKNIEVVLASSGGGCDYPTEEFNYTTSMTMCPNTNYNNNTGIYNLSAFGFKNLSINKATEANRFILTLNRNIYYSPALPWTNIIIANSSIKFRNLTGQGYARVDVFNGSSINAQCLNTLTCNVSMLPNHRAIVLSYLTLARPFFWKINNSILTLNYSYSSHGFAFTSTGSGAITINNTAGVGNSYRVYHNGVFLGTSNTRTYTTDGTSGVWLFTLENLEIKSEIAQTCVLSVGGMTSTSSLLPMAIAVLFLVIILPIILLMYSGKQHDFVQLAQESTGSMVMIIIAVIIIVVLILMGAAMIAGVANIFC